MYFTWVIAWFIHRQLLMMLQFGEVEGITVYCPVLYNTSTGLKTISSRCDEGQECCDGGCCNFVTTSPATTADVPFYMTWYFWTLVIVIILTFTGIMGAYTRYLALKKSRVNAAAATVPSVTGGLIGPTGQSSQYFLQNAARPPSYEEATLASIKWRQTHVGVEPWLDTGLANRSWHSLMKPMMPAYKTGFAAIPDTVEDLVAVATAAVPAPEQSRRHSHHRQQTQMSSSAATQQQPAPPSADPSSSSGAASIAAAAAVSSLAPTAPTQEGTTIVNMLPVPNHQQHNNNQQQQPQPRSAQQQQERIQQQKQQPLSTQQQQQVQQQPQQQKPPSATKQQPQPPEDPKERRERLRRSILAERVADGVTGAGDRSDDMTAVG